MDYEHETPKSLAEFTAKPVFQYTLLREAGAATDTALQLRVTRSSAATACKAIIICYSDSLAAFTFYSIEYTTEAPVQPGSLYFAFT